MQQQSALILAYLPICWHGFLVYQVCLLRVLQDRMLPCLGHVGGKLSTDFMLPLLPAALTYLLSACKILFLSATELHH